MCIYVYNFPKLSVVNIYRFTKLLQVSPTVLAKVVCAPDFIITLLTFAFTSK